MDYYFLRFFVCLVLRFTLIPLLFFTGNLYSLLLLIEESPRVPTRDSSRGPNVPCGRLALTIIIILSNVADPDPARP
jgi:hypothetical protein